MADQGEPAASEGDPWEPKGRRGPSALPASNLPNRAGRFRNPERGPMREDRAGGISP